MSMDEKLFHDHLKSPDFLIGFQKGHWGFISEEKDWPSWPVFFLWISAASRPGSPDKFVLKFILDNYNQYAPQGIFWDLERNSVLEPGKRPNVQGVHERAFRVDWQNGLELYAPWDRSGLKSHPEWLQVHKGFSWEENRDQISKYLRIVYTILNSESYYGIFQQ